MKRRTFISLMSVMTAAGVLTLAGCSSKNSASSTAGSESMDKLQSIQNLRGAVKTEVKFTMNVKETGKKAIEGIAIFIYYFEN